MELRLYILGAAVLLFVASLGYFIWVLMRLRRRRVAPPPPAPQLRPEPPATLAEVPPPAPAETPERSVAESRPPITVAQDASRPPSAPAPATAGPAPVAAEKAVSEAGLPPLPEIPDVRIVAPPVAEVALPTPLPSPQAQDPLEWLASLAPEAPPLPAPPREPAETTGSGDQDAEGETLVPLGRSAPPLPPVAEMLTELAEPLPVPAPSVVPPAAAAPSPPAPSAPAPAAPLVPEEHRLVAPVELHFIDAGGVVGVRPGTATYERFQYLAADLLGELKRVSPPQAPPPSSR